MCLYAIGIRVGNAGIGGGVDLFSAGEVEFAGWGWTGGEGCDREKILFKKSFMSLCCL